MLRRNQCAHFVGKRVTSATASLASVVQQHNQQLRCFTSSTITLRRYDDHTTSHRSPFASRFKDDWFDADKKKSSSDETEKEWELFQQYRKAAKRDPKLAEELAKMTRGSFSEKVASSSSSSSSVPPSSKSDSAWKEERHQDARCGEEPSKAHGGSCRGHGSSTWARTNSHYWDSHCQRMHNYQKMYCRRPQGSDFWCGPRRCWPMHPLAAGFLFMCCLAAFPFLPVLLISWVLLRFAVCFIGLWFKFALFVILPCWIFLSCFHHGQQVGRSCPLNITNETTKNNNQ